MRQTPPLPTPLTHEVVADVKLPAPVRRLRQVVATSADTTTLSQFVSHSAIGASTLTTPSRNTTGTPAEPSTASTGTGPRPSGTESDRGGRRHHAAPPPSGASHPPGPV